MKTSLLTLLYKVIGVLIPVLAIVAALGVGALMILAVKANPLVAYQALFSGAFGSKNAMFETLVKATPLLLAALGVGLAYRGSVWNIGAEGQLQMGALAVAALGQLMGGLPPVVAIFLLVLIGFAAGGLWGSIAGVLKARFRVSEIITTIMLNYVALLLVTLLVSGPLRNPTGGGVSTRMLPRSAWLPLLFPPSRLHAGIVLAILAAIAVYILLWRTTLGYKIRVVGANAKAARCAGINTAWTLVSVMFLSGGLAGLAGMSEVTGLHYRLIDGFSPSYGYTAIVVALLGKLHPFGIILSAVLFGGLVVGADTMARAAGVPIALVYVIQGLIVLFVLGSEILVQRGRKFRESNP